MARAIGGVPRPGAINLRDFTPPTYRGEKPVPEPAVFDSALEAMRQEAGRRYGAAVQELIEALADLAAIEGAMPNGPGTELRSFAASPPDAHAFAPFRHREFTPAVVPKSLHKIIADRRAALKRG